MKWTHLSCLETWKCLLSLYGRSSKSVTTSTGDTFTTTFIAKVYESSKTTKSVILFEEQTAPPRYYIPLDPSSYKLTRFKTPQTTPRPIRQAQPRKYLVDDDKHVSSVPRNKPDKATGAKKQTKYRSQTFQKSRANIGMTTPTLHSNTTLTYHLENDVLDNDDLDPHMHSLCDELSFPPAVTDPYDSRDVLSPMLDFGGISAVEVSSDRLSDVPDASLMLQMDRPLSREQRMAMYNSLDTILGPACGIQESVGTYRKYMQEQSRLYYDRLNRNSERALGTPGVPVSSKPDKSTTGSEDYGADFRRWLLCGRIPMASRVFPIAASKSTSQIGIGTADSFSMWESHIATQDPIVCYSPGYDKTADTILDDFLPEFTPIDTLCHLLDSDDPVVRSTVPCTSPECDIAPSRYEPKVTFDLSTPGVGASDEGADGGNPAILSPVRVLDRSRKPSHRRYRNDRMRSSAVVVEPIGSEIARIEEPFVQLVHGSTSKTAALRNLRKRSSSSVSARLRTTSAGGGM